MRRRTIAALVAAVVVALALAGAAIATAMGSFDGGSLDGSIEQRARAAALEITGGGRVGETERDGEGGATYEVEVTRPDGTTVDVHLDDRFELVAVEGDVEEADGDADDGQG